MNWEDFENEMKTLAGSIDDDFDMVVGIVRGGVVPARFFSKYLRVKNMYCLSVKKIGEERKVFTEILEDLDGKNVLVVEDMLETGRSLVVAQEYLRSKGAKVKTACLYTMPISEIKPDFYLRQIQEVKKFPWE